MCDSSSSNCYSMFTKLSTQIASTVHNGHDICTTGGRIAMWQHRGQTNWSGRGLIFIDPNRQGYGRQGIMRLIKAKLMANRWGMLDTARIYRPHYLPIPSMGLVIFPILKHKNQANEGKHNHTWMLWIVENDPICIGYSSHMLILNKSKYALVESSLAIGIINASNSPFPSMNLNSIIPSHQ